MKPQWEKMIPDNRNPLREQGANLFKNLPFPHKKQEHWKYTALEDFLPEQLDVNEQDGSLATADSLFPHIDAHRLFIINGKLDRNQSTLPEKMVIHESVDGDMPFSLSELDSKDEMEAFNQAAFKQGIGLTLPKGTVLEKPLMIFHLGTETSSQMEITRLHFQFGPNTEAQILEFLMPKKSCLQNVTTLTLENNAHIEHIRINLGTPNSLLLATCKAYLKKDAQLNNFALTLGGKLTRQNINVYLQESGSFARVNGLYCLKENEHGDHNGQIHHLVEKTTSNQLYKGIVDDEGHGIFTGKVIIHREAIEVDATQLNKNILLSKKAHVNSRPQLEVYADDVKAAHGATVGQISPEEVFYLQSRGIDYHRAQKIICHAFAREPIEYLKSKAIGDAIGKLIFDEFEKRAMRHFEEVEVSND